MRRIGLIGGTGPATTCRYYMTFIEKARVRLPDTHVPVIAIESIDCGEVFEALAEPAQDRLADYLSDAVSRLRAAGVQTAAFAGFSAHLVLDQVRSRVPEVEIISIVEPAARLAQSRGFRRLGIFGGSRVISCNKLFSPFMERGIELIRPTAEECLKMNHLAETEVEFGIRNPASLAYFESIIKRMQKENRIDALLLANTDYPSYFEGCNFGIEFVDPVQLHIEALIERYFEN